jgi:hypothetical protein
MENLLSIPQVRRRSSAASALSGQAGRDGVIRRALMRIGQWCRTHRHWSMAEQHAALGGQMLCIR